MTPVRYETLGSTAWLTLDNPTNRNAMTATLLDGISSGIEMAESDPGVRSVVLTHTGNTFCAGADLTALRTRGGGSSENAILPQLRENGAHVAAVARLLMCSPKPIIAAVHGHVRAGGMGLVAGCDFVVAGPRASFGLSEVRVGVVAAIISPMVLERIGGRTAAEWLLRGVVVTPAEAVGSGFVTRAVDDVTVTVEQAIEDILSDLRAAAPGALAASKRLVNRAVLSRFDAELAEMLELSADSFAGHEGQSGIHSFLHRTSPPWLLDR